MIRWLFHDGEHKINNKRWIRNGDEAEGWNEAKPKGNAEYFFNLHFLDQKWSKDLEFLHLQNWEDSANIWQICTKHTVMSTDSTVLFCAQKARQKNQCNETSRPLKSSALSPYNLSLLHCRQNHNLFMKQNERENKENAVRLIVHSITHRGEM